jgi:hypothetical protein
VFCPECDTRHPSTANFCMNCGVPLRESVATLRQTAAETQEMPPPQWEYQEFEIPLNFDSGGLSDEQVIERYHEVVSQRLAETVAAGWQSDEATDFQTLWADGRIKWRAEGTLHPTCAFESVAIRLKRLQP